MAGKRLKISPKKTLILSLTIIAVCIGMLFLSNYIANKNNSENLEYAKRTEKDKNTEKQPSKEKPQKTVDKVSVAEQPKAEKRQEPSKISETKPNKVVEKEPVKPEKTSKAVKPLDTDKKVIIASGKKEEDTKKPVPVPQPVKPAAPAGSKGIVIIIFDDGGHNLKDLQPYLNIPFPVTISVLPALAYSAETAKKVRNAGKELMLHQPMQAINLKIDPGKKAILPTMGDMEIRQLLAENLAEIGPVDGLNNHEGSLITESAWAMGIVLDVCATKNIYFVDSRTSSNTQAPLAASERGMKIYERDIFIDNTNDHNDMLKEIAKGFKIAEKKGHVIMIGHVRPHGLAKLLTDNYKEWERQGYAFSTISKAGAKIK